MYQILFKGEANSFDCKPGASLLASMGESGKEIIPVGCRAGGCGICKIRIIEGGYETKVMSRAQVTEQEEKAGFVLACRVFPRSDMVIEAAS